MRIKLSDWQDKALNSFLEIHLICRLPGQGTRLTEDPKGEITGGSVSPDSFALSSRAMKQIV